MVFSDWPSSLHRHRQQNCSEVTCRNMEVQHNALPTSSFCWCLIKHVDSGYLQSGILIWSNHVYHHVVFTHFTISPPQITEMLWCVPRIHSKIYSSVSSRNKPELCCPAELKRLLDLLTMLSAIWCGYWLRHLRCFMGHATHGTRIRLSVCKCGDLHVSNAALYGKPKGSQ